MTAGNDIRLDPVDVDILAKALDNVAAEMGTVMMRASGSPAIAEAVDFSTFIADAEGDIISYAGYITMYLGAARQAVRHILATYPRSEIRAGDMFLCNDPFTTGNAHAVDVGVVRPIFIGGELMAWCWAEAHVNDFGGFAPGGMNPIATEAYGEALRLPGVKIVDQGRPVEDVWRIIETNIRVPELVLNDIRCFIAACHRCDERLQALIGRYGTGAFRTYVEAAKDLAEQAVRRRIADLPDGTYTAEEFAEHNGHTDELYPVRCTLTVTGDALRFDLTDSAPQTDGFINVSAATTLGAVVSPLLITLLPDLPINQGTLRPIEVVTKPGTICDARMPAPMGAGHIETGFRIGKLVTRLLADLQAGSDNAFVREHVMAPWQDSWSASFFYAPDEDGRLVPFPDMNGGGSGAGAQAVADGMDVSGVLAQPQNSIPDIEINELVYPVLYLWRRLNPNSGGPGRTRGGAGIDLAFTPWYTPGGQEHVMAACWQVPPSGVFGGYPGSTSGSALVSGARADEALAQGRIPRAIGDLAAPATPLQGKQFGLTVGAGDVVVLRVGGGGGHGDPIERDPARVAADVRSGVVTVEAARVSYGVVLDDTGRPDPAATSAERERIRRERRSWAREDGLAVRRSAAHERLAERGQWCQARPGVQLVEYADPGTGALVRADVVVRTGDR
ncbi:hydantoinase B/oxoprolinase family protein [Amycolatopsis tucumanensis]|uniref:Hydantoinase B/oxoprolinase domain-containing protein n=1 Tax=Amycolatopsis tucumanensis TaxID=401106 RepID=A0ABP7HHR6_9PSEU|nr:hydantoinase B/oxoprolinase family protein [Amycolatopsis tucumanensis]MCF6426973.1 hydantoinase B/oxoprolinase family protein [Amycolatopsis tucumanensis]